MVALAALAALAPAFVAEAAWTCSIAPSPPTKLGIMACRGGLVKARLEIRGFPAPVELRIKVGPYGC